MTPAIASAAPATPPGSVSASDSVSDCRTSRLRPAPSANRTARSRRRAVARDSRRLETFAHVINSTSPAAIIRSRMPSVDGPTTS